jgi:hypothetical protein
MNASASMPMPFDGDAYLHKVRSSRTYTDMPRELRRLLVALVGRADTAGMVDVDFDGLAQELGTTGGVVATFITYLRDEVGYLAFPAERRMRPGKQYRLVEPEQRRQEVVDRLLRLAGDVRGGRRHG